MENVFYQKGSSEKWETMPGKNIAFKYHLVSYLVMNVFFWLSWLSYGSGSGLLNGLPWPLYPMLFGAIGLFCHFLAIFIFPEQK
jgi:hypothetical protein